MKHTIGLRPNFGDHIADSNIDDAQETLVLLLKLLLIKDLHRQDAIFISTATDGQ